MHFGGMEQHSGCAWLDPQLTKMLAAHMSPPFRLPTSAEDAAARAAALMAHAQLGARLKPIKAAIARQKRLAQAVELGEKTRQVKRALDDAARRLR